MKHSFIDKYSNLDSPLHKIPALIKIILCLIFLMYIQLIDKYLFIITIVALILVIISKIPFVFIIKRILVILPFILFISIFNLFNKDKQAIFFSTVAKSILSILFLILLVSTTKFQDLIYSLEKLKFPKIITLTLSFMYRYFFVIIDCAERMERAILTRTFNGKFKILKTFLCMIGILFIRSYERSERVYYAMLMRGFDK